MRHPSRIMILALPLALGACVSMPTGPSVLVLPGTGMSFDQFRYDEAVCRQYAAEQTGLSAEQAAGDAGVRSAALGAALGAIAGAAIDGRHGAGVGAGTGLLVGGMAGTGTAQVSAYEAQRRYDNGYLQCMYAKGHRVPVSGRYSYPPERMRQPAAPAPAAPQYQPPPPPAR